MTKPIFILNGPNLNLLGVREPEIYGSTTLPDVEVQCRDQDAASGIIINPAAYTHTSVAILDALNAFDPPVIELHISNPHKREEFRHKSYVTLAATGLICGLGVRGYPLAVDAMAALIKG